MTEWVEQDIQISDYTYDLPEDRIAKYPLAGRELSKLLVYKNSSFSEDIFQNISEHIAEGSLLIYNDTKVMHARLHFKNSKGGRIEIFCLGPAEPGSDPLLSLEKTKNIRWNCLVGRIAKWKERFLYIEKNGYFLSAELLQKGESENVIGFSWKPETLSFAEVLEKFGEMPIPPYLKRESEEIDQSRYQTVYADREGSVAAPTAGLHFTDSIIKKLESMNISGVKVTLHVGAGTFKPVKSELIRDHQMHAEWIDVSKLTIERILQQLEGKDSSNAIISVGTTSLRTIESLYWMGVKSILYPDSKMEELEIMQWDPYKLTDHYTSIEAIGSLLLWMNKYDLKRLVCKTQIMIVPTYKLKIADALVTNFHQPNSTLLLLVAAITGNDWRKIYDHALNNNFRFLSYGDGSLLFGNRQEQAKM